MATVSDIVTDALFAIGAYGQSESLDPNDAALALRRLVRLVDTWANDDLTIYDTTEETITLVAGTASYSTTLLTAGRPVSVASIFLRLSNIDYPVAQIGEAEYDAQAYKPATGCPGYFYFAASYPDGAIYFYPAPSDAYVAHVKSNRPILATTITLASTLALPPGYEAALCDNLAVDLAPSFGRPASQELMESARKSLAAIKRTNFSPGYMSVALPGSSEGYVPGYLRIQGDT